MRTSLPVLSALMILSATPALSVAQDLTPETNGGYRQVGVVALGSPERWDYVISDAPSGRVYVAHGDQVAVVDGHAMKKIGDVAGISGVTHGIYAGAPSGLGFTDDGPAGKAVAFDLKTLKITQMLPAAPDADAITGEGDRVYVMDGDSGLVTVIDARGPKVVANVEIGGSLEGAALDGRGHLFVNGADRGEVVRIDTSSNTLTARWQVPDCKSPHGMAIDAQSQRLFVSCQNSQMDILDTETGKEVASVPIGLGTDTAAFDPIRKRIFSSNGKSGNISVIQEVDPNTYRALSSIQTQIGARTMAVDVSTGRLFVATADIDPSSPTTGHRRFLPSTLKLLVFDPVD